MKVLIVTFEYLPFSGGIAKYTFEIAHGLANLNCEVKVLAPSYPNQQDDRQRGFKVIRMNVRHESAEFLRFLPGLAGLFQGIRSFTPDIVLLNSDLAHGIGGFLCYLLRLPFVAVIHGSEITKHFPPQSFKKRFQRPWLHFCYSRANAIVCVSKYVRDLVKTAGFDETKLKVIYNGVDESLLSKPVNRRGIFAIRKRHNLHGKKILATVARLVRRKGQDRMIAAMPSILSRDSNICYVVVGAGEDEVRLKQLARQLNVAHAVIFTGEISEGQKNNYIDLCDIFVLLSRHDGQRVEGLGISLLEAAARGKPLIGAPHGGISEIIAEGSNGHLIDPANIAQLTETILELLNTPALIMAMGAAAKAKVAKHFTTSGMAGKTKALFDSVLR